MKKLFLILFLAIGYFANAQVPTGLPTLFNGKWYRYTQYLQSDSGFFNPQRDTTFKPNRAGCVVFRTADSILYIYTGSRWRGVGSGGGTGVYNAGYGLNLTGGTFRVDSSLISTKLWRQKGVDSLNAVKLNKSDTAAMLLPYLRKGDTASMLSKYLRKGDTAAMLNPYLRKNDTITLSNRINLKRNYSDTALNSASTTTRGRSQYLIDSMNYMNYYTYRPRDYTIKIITDTNYVVDELDDVIFLRDATIARTLVLLQPSANIGKQIIITFRGTGSKWDFTVLGSGAVLDKAGATVTFIPYNTSYTLISDGTDWIII